MPYLPLNELQRRPAQGAAEMSSTLRCRALRASLSSAVACSSAPPSWCSRRSQALVFQFGQVARPPITQPGLYFKWPIIENVIDIDKRILDLELPTQEVIASDQKRLVVDAFTRYRVDRSAALLPERRKRRGRQPMRLTSIVNSTLSAPFWRKRISPRW